MKWDTMIQGTCISDVLMFCVLLRVVFHNYQYWACHRGLPQDNLNRLYN